MRPPSIVAPKLTKTFEKLSVNVWDYMRLAYGGGLLIGEESLTEMLLIELVKHHAQDAIAIPFTRQQETRIGADWEWWLTDGVEWLGLLVQAKSLSVAKHKYLKLNYHPKRSARSQLESLILNADHRSIYPLVCCYNYTQRTASIEWNCKTLPRRNELFGCSIVSARAAEVAARGHAVGVRKLSAVSYPLVCLVGCVGFAQALSPSIPPTLPHRALVVVRALDEASASEPSPVVPRLREDPPWYIRMLLTISPEQRRGMVEQIRRELSDIGGVLILKDGNPEMAKDLVRS